MSLPVCGSDYCTTQLVAATDQTSTTLLVASPTEPFPLFDATHLYFYITLVDEPSYISDANPPTQREIVKVTAYAVVSTGYSLTCVRGSAGTNAQIWAVGSVAEIRPCAQWFEDVKGSGGDGGGVLKSVEFTSSGTWTVPTGLTGCWITAIGGGAGGYCPNATINGGGGGGSGEQCAMLPLYVVPAAVMTITIGAGGAGGTTGTHSGTAGGATSIGPFTFLGGRPGIFETGGININLYTGGPGGGWGGGAATTTFGSTGSAESANFFGGSSGGCGGGNTAGITALAGSYGAGNGGILTGGAGGAASGGNSGGGGGAASPYGTGGAGGTGSGGTGGNGIGYGSGGGGGGGPSGLGGAGKSGYLLIMYVG